MTARPGLDTAANVSTPSQRLADPSAQRKALAVALLLLGLLLVTLLVALMAGSPWLATPTYPNVI